MNLSFFIWKLLAGIAFFLLGMGFIEESLRSLAGRRFKLFLKKQTSTNIKSITTGTLITGIFQSSSVVNTMVLAFVGAGVLTMPRAIAVILGDNLGTTVDSWFFAFAGFTFNIQSFSYAFTGIAGILMVLLSRNKRWLKWSRLLMGIGLLFLGLEFIKNSMMELVLKIDLNDFRGHGAVYFFFTGLVITTLIQSSSATMIILLSALYAGAISLYNATAVVLGSEIGTTLKFLLVSINGISIQKKVAAGNFLFNVITSLLMLLFLGPVNYFITAVIGISNHLVGLVFFQSFINLAGILLFFPFLTPFSGFLDRLFTKNDADTVFIHNINAENTDLAMEAFEKEARVFINCVIQFSLDIFNLKWTGEEEPLLPGKFSSKAVSDKYNAIKHLHGELLTYYIELQKCSAERDDTVRLNNMISAVRNCMYAAKSMKDALPDAVMLRNSSNQVKYDFYLGMSDKTEKFYMQLLKLINGAKTPGYMNALSDIFKKLQDDYNRSLKGLYQHNLMINLDEIEISSLINFNRQLYTAFKSMVLSVKDYFLTEKESEYFEAFPGFIH